MAGLFGLNVSPITTQAKEVLAVNEFSQKTLFWGTSYCQHLSGEFTGLSVFNGAKIVTDNKPGLFSPNFKGRMDSFVGTTAVGYCGPAKEPFYVKKSKVGSFSACFCGDVNNLSELVVELTHEGHTFEREDDIEVISKLIVQGADIVEGIKWMAGKTKGAFALLVLTPEGIYAVRSSDGHWPLVIGEHKERKAVVIASESVGFNNLGFERVRDIEPREIVLLKDGVWTSLEDKLPEAEEQECAFYGAYTCSPSAIVHGLPATVIRKKLGLALAKRDIADGFIPHIVMGMPDSGICHAIGYIWEFVNEVNRQLNSGKITIGRVPYYDMSLFKYLFVRSYLAPTQSEREEKAHYKIVITGETIEHILQMLEEAGLTFIVEDIKLNGRIIIVVCDDSIVRGSQVASNLAPKLKLIFEKKIDRTDIRVEIHLRISFPELRSHCPHGKTTKKGETLVERVPLIEDRITELGVNGLKYNTILDLVEILGRPREKLCLDCILSAK